VAIRTRRGSAGEDVTATEQFVEDVVATDEDQSYEVEGTDSPEYTVQEATVITDDHEVVNPIEDGEIVDEEIEETREGRRGSRKGYGEDEEVEEVIMNEDGDTQEVELPEPDEEELEEREGRRGRRTRRGSRKGATMVDGKSPMEYLRILHELQWFPEEREILASGDEDAAEEYLKKDAQLNNQTYEEAVRSIVKEYDDLSDLDVRNGSHKGSRKGNAYGGKSEVHQESIKAAVAVAMRDRRL
jgi:hypothetical protein